MFCAKCGAEILEGGRFCSRCGAPVVKPVAAESDAELERLAAQGDQEAFAELYSRHSSRVYDFLLRIVRDPEEAADLMQETFLRAMRALSTEERGAAFSTWLFTIARNLALKRLERRKRTVALAEREGEEELPIYRQVDPDRLADPEAAAEAQELTGLVWEAAAALEAKQYSLLDLHVRQGLESAEIAQVLGVSKGNAYTMMSRLKDTFEGAVASLFMLRLGRRECPELNRLLEERSIAALSPTVRKLIERHTTECEVCQEQRRRLVSPANILRAFAPMPLPLVLKQRVAEALVASWAEVGTQAAAVGLKGFLAQPAAKLASLPTAWKAGLIAGVVTLTAGGGLGGWMGVTGGLPGSGGDEAPEAAPPALAEFSPTPTPSAVATAVEPLPPAGARIAFQSNRDTMEPWRRGVYVMDADGSNVARIGTRSAWDSPPSSEWSPDGSRVAFHKCPETPHAGANWAGLYVMNADGSGLTSLASGTLRCFTEGGSGGLSWSPDGTRIVFYKAREPYGLYIVDADGGNLRYLTEGIFPQWSPLGDSIVFVGGAEAPPRCGISLINPDGTNRRLLARVPCEWLPDFRVDGTACFCAPPQWSPDGSMLAFSASPEEPPQWQQELPLELQPEPQREVFIMGADGSGLTNITNHPADDHSPIWVDCRVPTAGCGARVTNVQPDPLNVREGPWTSWGEVTGSLSEGDALCLVGSPFLEDGYKWWPIYAADGTEGWVAAFDPKDPATPWITPTGEPCLEETTPVWTPTPVSSPVGAESPDAGTFAHAPTRTPTLAPTSVPSPTSTLTPTLAPSPTSTLTSTPGTGECGEQMSLGASIEDSEGDVPFTFIDMLRVRVEAVGEEVLAEIKLKDLPGQLTFRAAPTVAEYAWLIFVDVDGDPNTGCRNCSTRGADYCLAIIHWAYPSDQILTGALLDNAQVAVWKQDPDGGWMEPAGASATADEVTDLLTIRGRIPGIGPSTSWCAESGYFDPESRRTITDRSPDDCNCYRAS